MIARQDVYTSQSDVWARLSAPVPAGAISWRQDGKVTARDGKFFARFVAYIEASTVRERLDSVVAGEWDLTLELLPAVASEDGEPGQFAFKARLQVLGVIREDVGMGRDYKLASTDAFKRAAVRFGIASELYSYEQNWVEMDGDGKFARAIEDPQRAYVRRYGTASRTAAPEASGESTVPATSMLTDLDAVSCPKCGGRMWDNRRTKRNPKAPDYKCQSRSCDGVIWPSKSQAAAGEEGTENARSDARPAALAGVGDELPF
jgi:hypothetical protein